MKTEEMNPREGRENYKCYQQELGYIIGGPEHAKDR